MKISKHQAELIAKSGNVALLNKLASIGSVSTQLTNEEIGLLRRTSEEEQQKSRICPSSGLVFVHNLDKEEKTPEFEVAPPVQDVMYHLYNMSYDKPIEQTMDELTKYARGLGIDKNRFRFAVENIDSDYLVKYESQYNEATRELLNEDDLIAMITDPEIATYYQEQERQEEEEEEEEEGLEAYGLCGFSF